MDRGATRKTQQGSKGTSRVTRGGAAGGGGGTSRRDRAQQQEGPPYPQQPKKDQSSLYIGAGVGAVLILILVAAMAGGGGGGGHAKNAEARLTKTMNSAYEHYRQRNFSQALQVLEEALSDPAFRGLPKLKDAQTLATEVRSYVNAERDAASKLADLKARVEKSKADQTAMKKAPEFWGEVQALLTQYGGTSSGQELRGIREDLRRWISTESQAGWQNDYNRTKSRIESSCLAVGKYSQAAREWRHFEESFTDPLLKSRIEQELRTIDKLSVDGANKLIASAGAGAEGRESLERALNDYGGTEGQQVIKKHLASLK